MPQTKRIRVSGYRKKDGTRVKGYMRKKATGRPRRRGGAMASRRRRPINYF